MSAAPSPTSTVVAIFVAVVAILAGSVINAGLPVVGCALSAPARQLPVLVSAYLLPLAIFLPMGGMIGDALDRRILLAWGAGLLAVGSLACAAATRIEALVGARLVQGLAAALILPNAVALVGAPSGSRTAGYRVSAYSAACAVATGLGPAIGGRLATCDGWRWLFAATAGLAVLGGAAIWFIQNEGNRQPSPPRLKLSLATPHFTAEFVALTLFTLCLYGGFFAFLVLAPAALEREGSYSPAAAGMALAPLSILTALLMPLVAHLQTRVRPAVLLALSAGCVALALETFARAELAGPYVTQVLPTLCALAVGMTLSAAPLTVAVLDAVQPRHAGLASGLNSAAARLGGTVSTAMLGPVFAGDLPGLKARVGEAVSQDLALVLVAAATAIWLTSRGVGQRRFSIQLPQEH